MGKTNFWLLKKVLNYLYPCNPRIALSVLGVVWNLFQRCVVQMYWSCPGVVTHGLPDLSWASVFPVCWYQRWRRAVVVWWQLKHLVTWDCDTPASSMPMAWFRCEGSSTDMAVSQRISKLFQVFERTCLSEYDAPCFAEFISEMFVQVQKMPKQHIHNFLTIHDF